MLRRGALKPPEDVLGRAERALLFRGITFLLLQQTLHQGTVPSGSIVTY